MSTEPITRTYIPKHTLKYGCNPHQAPSTIASIQGQSFPFEILNGTPGYINLLDALNSWQLVHEVRQALNMPAAASFKHVSPAGAGIATPLSDVEKEVYDVGDYKLTPQAVAYLRARNADPKCSFGDFAALSDEVDEETALFLKREVSDGIIAPGFTDAALAILKQKKNGAYIILKADVNYVPPAIEYREVYGVVFAQKRNDALIKVSDFTDKIPTQNKSISENALRDLVLATIAIKYTQSNSVGYAKNGMMIGVGAGQQSRVDCVKLAASKLEIWYLRQHPKVRGLEFKPDVKRVDKTNARISYIEGGMTAEEQKVFEDLFVKPPVPLTAQEKSEWIATLKGVSISSDAFFPFRDNVDQASKRGVAHIAQPAGSVQDAVVVAAADEYGMTISHTPNRLFHH